MKSWSILGSTSYVDESMIFSFSETTLTEPPPLTSATMELTLKTYIAPRDELNTTQEFNLDGSATVEVIYL